MQADRNLHLRLQIGRQVADDVGGHGDLIVGFHIHEMEAVGVLIHELMLAVLDEGALDLVGGLEAQRTFTPSAIRRTSIWVTGCLCRDGYSRWP